MLDNIYAGLFLFSVFMYFVTLIIFHFTLYKFFLKNKMAEDYGGFILKSPVHYKTVLRVSFKNSGLDDLSGKRVKQVFFIGWFFLIMIFVLMFLWF
ncbi:hypothetical protein QR665_09720 [Acinetobacter gerneri]|uniref:hypothetical protein n=1 Tax=Acinetobacter gerneri TaxID=202952 RepID=UPI00293695A6|nr:hypothetical protein [Acinetobacter gerneri]MDV2439747.1 hypothetical protein [Acinetobacter gerneri]